MTPDKIRAMREHFGESREDFARRVGATAKSIYNWETGVNSPKSRAMIDRLEQTQRGVDRALTQA